MYAYRRDEEDGSEGDLSLCHKVCFGEGILRILKEGLIEFTVLLILYLFHTGEEGERERKGMKKIFANIMAAMRQLSAIKAWLLLTHSTEVEREM